MTNFNIMLNVIKYLNSNKSVQDLISEFNLNHRFHSKFPELIQLTYHQLETPKNEITNECRGLILDVDNNFNVISYPFNRFGDYNPKIKTDFDFNNCRYYDKIDGSIITLYNYKNSWNVSTKSLPDASGRLISKNTTYNDYFWQVWKRLKYDLPEETFINFIFEFKFPEGHLTQATTETISLIGARDLITLNEIDIESITKYNWKKVNYKTSTLQDIYSELREVDPMEIEGYVACLPVLDESGNFKRFKIKSPQYEAISLLRCNQEPDNRIKQQSCDNANFRRLVDIVRTNSITTFLKYPKYETIIPLHRKVLDAYDKAVWEINKFLKNIDGLGFPAIGIMLNSTYKKQPFLKGIAFPYINKQIDSVEDWLFNIDIKNAEEIIKYYMK